MTGTLFPVFGVPDWGIRFVVIVHTLGFAPALVISWAYELPPEGLKREKDVMRDTSITHVTAKTSSLYFKDKDFKVSEIARELNVCTILEGSVGANQSGGRTGPDGANHPADGS